VVGAPIGGVVPHHHFVHMIHPAQVGHGAFVGRVAVGIAHPSLGGFGA